TAWRGGGNGRMMVSHESTVGNEGGRAYSCDLLSGLERIGARAADARVGERRAEGCGQEDRAGIPCHGASGPAVGTSASGCDHRSRRKRGKGKRGSRQRSAKQLRRQRIEEMEVYSLHRSRGQTVQGNHQPHVRLPSAVRYVSCVLTLFWVSHWFDQC